MGLPLANGSPWGGGGPSCIWGELTRSSSCLPTPAFLRACKQRGPKEASSAEQGRAFGGVRPKGIISQVKIPEAPPSHNSPFPKGGGQGLRCGPPQEPRGKGLESLQDEPRWPWVTLHCPPATKWMALLLEARAKSGQVEPLCPSLRPGITAHPILTEPAPPISPSQRVQSHMPSWVSRWPLFPGRQALFVGQVSEFQLKRSTHLDDYLSMSPCQAVGSCGAWLFGCYFLSPVLARGLAHSGPVTIL